MHYYISNSEIWNETNERVKAEFFPQVASVRVYNSVGLALHDTARATSQFMTHKKSIALVSSHSPFFESVLPWFYKDHLEVQLQKYASKESKGVVLDWAKGLKDLSIGVWALDHALTAEKSAWSDDLMQFLHQQRVMTIVISHFTHLSVPFSQIQIAPYEVRLLALQDGRCVALCGERFKTPTQIGPWGDLKFADIESVLKKSEMSARADASVLKAAQSEISQLSSKTGVKAETLDRALPEALMTEAPQDRLMVVFEELAGDNLVKTFALKYPELSSGIATTHVCEHPEKIWNWIPNKNIHSVLSSLIILGVDFAKDKKNLERLFEIAQELKSQQTWSW